MKFKFKKILILIMVIMTITLLMPSLTVKGATYTLSTTVRGVVTNYTYEEGDTLNIPIPDPTSEEVFREWYWNGTSNTFDDTVMPAYDVNITAQFSTAYTLTTNVDGVLTDYYYAFGDNLNLSDPIQTGYTFMGWYTDSEFLNPSNYVQMPQNNLTLYADMSINTYNFTTIVEGVSETLSYAYGQTLYLPNPVKTGYTFIRWNYTGTGTEFTGTTMPASNTSVTAVFTTVLNVWTLTLLDGSNTIYTVDYTYGDNIDKTLWPVIENNSNYAFKYWVYNTTSIEFTDTTMPDYNVTLNSFYEPSYTLTTNVEGVATEYYYAVADPLVLPTPTKEGYTFMRWVWQGTNNTFEFVQMPQYDVNIVAEFDINTYNFTTIVEGISETLSYAYGQTLYLPDPVKTGYTFIRWDYTDTETEFTGTTMPASNTSVTAIFTTVLNVWTLTTDVDGVITNYTYSYGDVLDIPDPVKEGFIFSHWVFTGNNVFNFTTMPDYGFTIYAQFGNTITTNVDGVITEYGYYTGDTINIPIPTKDNFVFSHWVYAGGNIPFNLTTMPSENIDIVAVWLVIIKFSSEGEIMEYLTSTATVGGVIDKPSDPYRQGYTFMGWYTTPSLLTQWNFNNDIAPNNTITLYAKWSQNVDVSIYDFFETTGLNSEFGKILFSVGVILFIVVVLALFHLNKSMIMIIGVGLLLGFIALGFIPAWLTILLTIITFGLFYINIKGGSSNV